MVVKIIILLFIGRGRFGGTFGPYRWTRRSFLVRLFVFVVSLMLDLHKGQMSNHGMSGVGRHTDIGRGIDIRHFTVRGRVRVVKSTILFNWW